MESYNGLIKLGINLLDQVCGQAKVVRGVRKRWSDQIGRLVMTRVICPSKDQNTA